MLMNEFYGHGGSTMMRLLCFKLGAEQRDQLRLAQPGVPAQPASHTFSFQLRHRQRLRRRECSGGERVSCGGLCVEQQRLRHVAGQPLQQLRAACLLLCRGQVERLRHCSGLVELDVQCAVRRRRGLGRPPLATQHLDVTQRALSVTQRGLLASPSEGSYRHPARALSVTQRALTVTQRGLLASPSELLASPSELFASPSEGS
jgi:hypothetical protein